MKATDPTDINKNDKEKNYQHHYTNKFDNLDKMENILEK